MHVQLQKELDRLGSQGWDLINISTIGQKLMFFSKILTTKVLIRVDFSGLSFYLLSPCFSYAVGLPKGHVIKQCSAIFGLINMSVVNLDNTSAHLG